MDKTFVDTLTVPRTTYKDHISRFAPDLLFKRLAAATQCFGVIICFCRRGGDEMANLSREIEKDLPLMKSKVHLIKRKLKQGTKLE